MAITRHKPLVGIQTGALATRYSSFSQAWVRSCNQTTHSECASEHLLQVSASSPPQRQAGLHPSPSGVSSSPAHVCSHLRLWSLVCQYLERVYAVARTARLPGGNVPTEAAALTALSQWEGWGP